MDSQIAQYLKENKDKYSKEILLEQLRIAGYQELDIAQGAFSVYGLPNGTPENVQNVPTISPSQDFWDFKSKKDYVNPGDKAKDFFFGLLAPYIISFAVMMVPMVNVLAILLLPLAAIFCLVYFFSRRRFIFYGLLTNMVAVPGVIFLLISMIYGF